MPTKSPLKSKTIWLQIVAVLSVLIPPVQEWMAANPVEFVSVLGALGVVVRFATSGKVSMFADGDGGSGGSSLPLIVALTAGAAVLSLPSCSVSLDKDGTYTFGPSAKVVDATLEYLIRENSKGWNYYDAETGDVITPDQFEDYGIEQ